MSKEKRIGCQVFRYDECHKVVCRGIVATYSARGCGSRGREAVLSTLNICYLFLGGAGAGGFFVLTCMDMVTPQASIPAGRSPHTAGASSAVRYVPQAEYARLFAPGLIVSLATVTLGTICLLVDLGRPDRVLNLFLHPVASYVALGSFALLVLIVFVAFLAGVWALGVAIWPRWVVRTAQSLGLACALVVMLYAGLLFYQIGTGLVLGSMLLPILFLLSSLSTGIASVVIPTLLTDAGRRFRTTLGRLLRLDAVVIVGEALCAVALLVFHGQGAGGSQAVAELIDGRYALAFLGGFGACGIVMPLVVDLLCRPRLTALGRSPQGLFLLGASGVLVGGYCLRCAIIGAGLPVFHAVLSMAGM